MRSISLPLGSASVLCACLLALSAMAQSGSWVLPASAFRAGVNGAEFHTDVRILNLGTSTVMVVATFYDQASGTSARAAEFPVAGRSQVSFDNILQSLFGKGLESGPFGPIRFDSTGPIVVSSSTNNVNACGAGATSGQWIPGIDMANALTAGAIPQVAVSTTTSGGYRTNLVVMNPGSASATVTVRVRAGGGELLSSGTIGPLGANGFRQVPLDDAGTFPGVAGRTDTNLWIEFTSTQPVLALASVINNASGDPFAVLATPDAPSGRMAFVSRQGSVSQIYLMDVDASGLGSNPTRLTSDPNPENYPSWSPDGRRLVYQRDFNGAAIYVINADGTGQRRLSPTPEFDVTASWSPDGTKIVYARVLQAPQPNGPPPMTDIRIMNADGLGDHAVLPNTVFSVEPRWSVNGQLVFMSMMNGSNLDIYVMNVDGTGIRRLTNGANNGDPVWSPDGTRITFGSDREGGGKLNIFMMNADGSQQVQLTHFGVPYEAGDTNWSSDGKKIAFQYDVNGMKQSDPNAYAEVWTMNADGGGAKSTRVPCSNVGCAPRWQPK